MAIQLRPDELMDIIRSEFLHATVTQVLPDNLIMLDDAWIGFGPAAGRIEFDSTPVPDEINFLVCNVGFGTQTPATNVNIYENNADTTPAFLIEQDSTGDAALEFLLTAGQAFSIGIDNNDGDKLKISDGANVHTGTIITIDPATDRVGIGDTTPDAILDVYQSGAAAAIPVLELYQADVSEGMINFDGGAGIDRGVITGATNSVASVRAELSGVVYRVALYANA